MVTQKTPNKPVGATGANLGDGRISYEFLLAPETLQWSHQASYSSNNVLDTSLPHVRWKHSSSTLIIPRLLFVSQGMTQDMSESIKQLTTWCVTGATLSFTFGSTVIARCHISKFSPTESQWRSGKVTRAEAALDLIISREPLAAVVTTTSTKPESLTDRERFNISNQVTKALKNPAIAAKLKAASKGTLVDTSTDGYVTLRDAKGVLINNLKVSDLKSQGVI